MHPGADVGDQLSGQVAAEVAGAEGGDGFARRPPLAALANASVLAALVGAASASRRVRTLSLPRRWRCSVMVFYAWEVVGTGAWSRWWKDGAGCMRNAWWEMFQA
ncbi:hypothetical protein SVIO_083690 [Streptomyces violaceusniger]|uniref:Uncharacterized protein n=1 Tax=Streptomyces violaceusniger TaxID=68280 RepID=A0A4D4LET3_STRVO|nr:hypothetical protein SVIO_083690 [Streptomyces violaceusniger]